MNADAAPWHVIRQAWTQVLRLTPPQMLFLSYLALSLAGTVLLKLPVASQAPTSWMQALFTAVSASTITGLVVLDTGSHFTLFGQSVLLVLMQAGGLGLMTFGVFVIHLSSGRLGLRQRAALSDALNHPGQSDMRGLLRLLVGFMITMELLGTFLLALQWVPEMGWQRGIYHSFFHAVSAFNNAGFVLAPDSLTAYVVNPLVNVVISLLFIAGGIGFVVLADMLGKKRFRDYQLHTKLMLVGTLMINLIAMLMILFLEFGNPDTLGALHGIGSKLWAAWFQAVVPRSSGFNTIDIGALTTATSFLIMGLMFIGAGTGSTGGGIKLTTFIILLLATRAFLMQHDRPVAFGRSIDSSTVLKALAVIMIGLLCVITGTFLLTVTERLDFLDLAFEAVSAASTTGLSRGVTAQLSAGGQIVIIVLMLIGRVGPLTLAFTLARSHGTRIQYPAGQVNIG
jgi:trk system potassium uptake protein TrkH